MLFKKANKEEIGKDAAIEGVKPVREKIKAESFVDIIHILKQLKQPEAEKGLPVKFRNKVYSLLLTKKEKPGEITNHDFRVLKLNDKEVAEIMSGIKKYMDTPSNIVSLKPAKFELNVSVEKSHYTDREIKSTLDYEEFNKILHRLLSNERFPKGENDIFEVTLNFEEKEKMLLNGKPVKPDEVKTLHHTNKDIQVGYLGKTDKKLHITKIPNVVVPLQHQPEYQLLNALALTLNEICASTEEGKLFLLNF